MDSIDHFSAHRRGGLSTTTRNTRKKRARACGCESSNSHKFIRNIIGHVPLEISQSRSSSSFFILPPTAVEFFLRLSLFLCVSIIHYVVLYSTLLLRRQVKDPRGIGVLRRWLYTDLSHPEKEYRTHLFPAYERNKKREKEERFIPLSLLYTASQQ